MKTVQLKQEGHFVLDEEKGQSGENGSTLTTQYIKKGSVVLSVTLVRLSGLTNYS